MRRLLFALPLLAGVAGCPTPPTVYEGSDASSTSNAASASGGQGTQGGQGMQGGGQGMQGGGQSMQGGQGMQGGGQGGGAMQAVLLELSQSKPQKTQEAVKAAEHVLVRGELTGDCEGAMRIDVIAAAQPTQGGAPAGPVTAMDVSALGSFEIAVPTGVTATMSALCDNDKDGRILVGTDALARPVELGQLSADRDGVTLLLEKLPQLGGQQGMGGPGSGQMSGGMQGGGMQGGGMQGGQQGGGMQGGGQGMPSGQGG